MIRSAFNLSRLLFTTALLLCYVTVTVAGNWEVNPFNDKAFVLNQGQYNGMDLLPNSDIRFAADQQSTKIFFTPKGLTYRFDVFEGMDEPGNVQEMQAQGLLPQNPEEEEYEPVKRELYTVNMEWVNANPNPPIISWDEVDHYYNFGMENDPKNDINNVQGFEKIMYKNLYPNIDVQYSFHEVEGIKYELILHPGADISAVEMRYTGTGGITFDGDDIFISTPVGDILDHAPITFYDDDKSAIASSFVVTGNTVKFTLDNYDNNRKVIVDPWSVSPALAAQNIAYDVEVDNAGNLYVYGGLNPYQVRKLNSAGGLLWVTNTLNNGQRPGDLAVDGAGNIYNTAGHNGGGAVPSISRLSPAGAILWNNTIGSYIEFWCLEVDNAGNVVTGDSFGPPGGRFSDIDITNGNRFNTTAITASGKDNRAMYESPNGNFFAITSDWGADERLVAVTPTFGLIFDVFSMHAPPYNVTPLYCNGPSPQIGGYNGVAASNTRVYTNSGSMLYHRNAANGALYSSLAIPGGAADNNSGVDVDECGNVYVGSGTGVYQYDSLLNLLAFQATSGAVYDVTIHAGTDVASCGNGFVALQSFGNGCAIVLSTELLTFSGRKEEGANVLEWSTASEHNSDYFTLERSVDGEYYQEVAQLDAAGNSNEKMDYEVTDHNPPKGTNYYRLKIANSNGELEYSEIVVIDSKKVASAPVIVPNPSTGVFTVQGATGKIQVLDMVGHVVLSSDVSQIDMSSQPKGIYFIRVGQVVRKLTLK